MKVKIIRSNEIITVNASYGLRLIEQGKAVPVRPEAPKPPKTRVAISCKTDKVGDA